MTIKVKFFASLRETIGQAEVVIETNDTLSANTVWIQATDNAPQDENVLCAVNLEHVGLDHAVVDGDEVAFFPPITGG